MMIRIWVGERMHCAQPATAVCASQCLCGGAVASHRHARTAPARRSGTLSHFLRRFKSWTGLIMSVLELCRYNWMMCCLPRRGCSMRPSPWPRAPLTMALRMSSPTARWWWRSGCCPLRRDDRSGRDSSHVSTSGGVEMYDGIAVRKKQITFFRAHQQLRALRVGWPQKHSLGVFIQ